MDDDPKLGPNRGNAGKGRPKGSQNKTTLAVKEAVLAALDQAGGINYLVKQADENPNAFLALVGKVLPLQVNASHDGTVVAQVVFRGLND